MSKVIPNLIATAAASYAAYHMFVDDQWQLAFVAFCILAGYLASEVAIWMMENL